MNSISLTIASRLLKNVIENVTNNNYENDQVMQCLASVAEQMFYRVSNTAAQNCPKVLSQRKNLKWKL